MSRNVPWIGISAIVISIFALIISGISSCHSNQANNISKEALQVSKEALQNTKTAFVKENRPYLTVKLVKHEDEESFFQAYKEDNAVVIAVQFKLSNKGKVPAKSISISSFDELGNNFIKRDKTLKVDLLPTYTLGPDDSVIALVHIEFKGTSEQRNKMMEAVKMRDYIMGLNTIWSYTSDLDETTTYKTIIAYTIINNIPRIRKSEIF